MPYKLFCLVFFFFAVVCMKNKEEEKYQKNLQKKTFDCEKKNKNKTTV